MAKREAWKPVAGLVLTDAENPLRVVRLTYRFDPQGAEHGPYWVVKNLQSGEETTVLEKDLHKRYNVPPAVGEVVETPPAEIPTQPDADTVQGQAPGAEPTPAA